MKSFLLTVAVLLAIICPAMADHPMVTATKSDRDSINSKIASASWAKEAYAAMKANVDKYVALCSADPEYMSSRLMMNWQTHFTQPIVEHDEWVGGQGHAPLPTPRFAGSRNWATTYVTPANFEDFKPYNDDPDGSGKVWLLNNATQQSGWTDPSVSGRTIELANVHILQLAANASFIYWLTGDEKYAAFAAKIFCTYMDGFQYIQLPSDITPGGKPNQIIGFTSFEVIHEESCQPLGLCYDFLHDYLVKQGYDVELVQAQFQRFTDRLVNSGFANGNWNMNEINNFMYLALTLEDDSHYVSHEGRQYYTNIILNAQSATKTGIKYVIAQGYDQQTALWPEAPGYGFGSTPQFVQMASLLSAQPAAKSLLASPFLTRAMFAQLNLLYPNGFSIGLGDTYNTRIRADGLELLIAAARKRGDTGTETSLTAALDREIAGGYWDRGAQSNIVALCEYVGTLLPITQGKESLSRSYFGTPLNVYLQRNDGIDADHSLAAAMYGTEGGHVHANGLNMELYGAGLIQGADPGRGASYWTPDNGQYYAAPPAHNTVIVNGKSDYNPYSKPQVAMQVMAAEPVSQQAPLSPNISFVESSFHYDHPVADQQRTLALIRTSPTSGFYFDVFRSRTPAGAGAFHDYLYHNVGQSMDFYGLTGNPLGLTSSSALGSKQGDLIGYDYFKNERSADGSAGFHTVFTATIDHIGHDMGLWMSGGAGRTVFSVEAPPDHCGKTCLPDDILQLPMPTVLVRQPGDAWNTPFVAVYEPYLSSDGPQIVSVTAPVNFALDPPGLAARIVEEHACQVVVVQADDSSVSHTVDGLNFAGAFGAVIDRFGKRSELYLGNGRAIGDSNNFIESTGPGLLSADLNKTGQEWVCQATAPVRISVTFSVPNAAIMHRLALYVQNGSVRREVPISQLHVVGSSAGIQELAASVTLSDIVPGQPETLWLANRLAGAVSQ